MKVKPLFLLIVMIVMLSAKSQSAKAQTEFFVYDSDDSTIITSLTITGTNQTEFRSSPYPHK